MNASTIYYLVRDWTDTVLDSKGQPSAPVDRVVYDDEIWNVIDEAREKQRRISIYKIGDCLVDWS